MFSRLLRAVAPAAVILAASQASAQADPPVTPAEMMRHIDRLASDEFQGRAPGTEGERLTINYIAEQLAARGAEPAGEGGTWFQPVRLAEWRAGTSTTRWTANGRALEVDGGGIILIGRDANERLADAPVIFAGHGARMPERGIDQLAGANVNGAVVLILLQGPQGVSGFPSFVQRTRTLTAAGAAAVIGIVGDELPWAAITRQLSQGTVRLVETPVPRIAGLIQASAAQRLIEAAGGDFGQLLNAQPGSSFRAVTLPLQATLDVATEVTRYTSNNVLGRIRGGGANSNESVLLLAHWDHFGICRPEGEADRICNGAVDNASGIAMMLEIAGRLGRQPTPSRDIIILATTSEEVGLLGAEYFAAHSIVPTDTIVVAINMDTVAIHPAGEPVAVIGRGLPALDRVIDETVAAMGRRLDTDDEAAAFVSRQDGYKLQQAGIPSIMVGGSFSNMALLNAFLGGPYHKPSDQLGGTIVLDGAAEDANLTVALVRRLADPAVYQRPPPAVVEPPEDAE